MLIISRVSCDCSCMSYMLPKRELAPGVSVHMTVRLDTEVSSVAGFRAPLKPKLVNLQVDLVTPEHAEAALAVWELIESYGWYTTVYVTGEIPLTYPDPVRVIHDWGHQTAVLGDMCTAYIVDFQPRRHKVSDALRAGRARLEGVEAERMGGRCTTSLGRLVYRAEGLGNDLVWHAEDLTWVAASQRGVPVQSFRPGWR